jgi:HEAT repeat protein
VLALAMFDADTRERVIHAVENGCRVHGSCLMVQLRRIDTYDDFRSLVGDAIELARRLHTPPDPAPRLARNACHDPEPAVRQRNLELLVERFAERDETTIALRELLHDPAPEIRLRAATGLGEDGIPMLEALAADADSGDSIAAEALRRLGASMPTGRVLEVLLQALRAERQAVTLAAIEVLGERAEEAAAARLRSVLTTADPELARAAARALGQCADPLAEEPLLAALEHPDATLRLAAAESLGAVGSVMAVGPLHTASAAHPLDLRLRRVVAASIAAIQARASGAAPGQLSLTDADAGELALTADDGGQVSLVDPEEPARDEE